MPQGRPYLAGALHPDWTGGRHIDRTHGYVMVYVPGIKGRGRYIPEHRLLVERALGRKLHPREIVHHLNGDKTDNRLENLELLSQKRHVSYHLARVRGFAVTAEQRQRLSEATKAYWDRGRIPMNESDRKAARAATRRRWRSKKKLQTPISPYLSI